MQKSLIIECQVDQALVVKPIPGKQEHKKKKKTKNKKKKKKKPKKKKKTKTSLTSGMYEVELFANKAHTNNF